MFRKVEEILVGRKSYRKNEQIPKSVFFQLIFGVRKKKSRFLFVAMVNKHFWLAEGCFWGDFSRFLGGIGLYCRWSEVSFVRCHKLCDFVLLIDEKWVWSSHIPFNLAASFSCTLCWMNSVSLPTLTSTFDSIVGCPRLPQFTKNLKRYLNLNGGGYIHPPTHLFST